MTTISPARPRSGAGRASGMSVEQGRWRTSGGGGRPRGASRRPRRATAVSVGLVLATVAAMAVGGAAAWRVREGQNQPIQAAVGETVGVSGLDLTIEEFSRRRDAVAGSNTKKLPLSGPAMPMNSMSASAGTGADGQTGMGSMPGMAGMLEDGQERVDVSVLVRNSDDEAHELDVEDFALLSNGRRVELLQETTSDMSQATIPPGSALASTITYVIPDGTAPLHLRYGDEPVEVVLDASTADVVAPEDPSSPKQAPAGGHGGGHS